MLTFSGLPTASYGWGGGGWGGWERSLGPHCCHTPAASFAFSTSASTMAGFESRRSLLCALLAMVIVLLEETISAIRMLTHPHLPHPMLNIADPGGVAASSACARRVSFYRICSPLPPRQTFSRPAPKNVSERVGK